MQKYAKIGIIVIKNVKNTARRRRIKTWLLDPECC